MIAAYLVYDGLFSSPESALQYFGRMRTSNGAGVTIPSQQRYVSYFSQLLSKYRPAQNHQTTRRSSTKSQQSLLTTPLPPRLPMQVPKLALKLVHVRLSPPPNFDVGGG